jgi:hypothetical protein
MHRDIDWESFVRRVDGTVVLVPCMSFVLLLDQTDDAGIVDFYDRCCDALGGLLTHYQAEGMNGFRKLNAQGNAKVRAWFGGSSRTKPAYYIQMSAATRTSR